MASSPAAFAPADYLGNPLTASEPSQVAAIDTFTHGLLAYQSKASGILAAADQWPGFVLGAAYAAALWMLLEAPEAGARAAPYVAAAKAGLGAVTPREASTVAFVAAWTVDDIDGALAIAAAHVAAFPRDLVMAKLYQYHAFNRGDFAAMLRAVQPALDHAADVPQTHGMAAFALEQLHLLDEAEDSARRALQLLPDEPWAQHALAHVMLTQGRIDEGTDFLESARSGWVGLNSFMETHLWWHLALFRLSQGRFDLALSAYDDHVWALAKDYSQDQIGAVSLLARLDLAGADVGDRWKDLAGYLTARAEDVVQPFLSLQYLYGLARGGRSEADRLMAAIGSVAQHGPLHARDVWAAVALPAAQGLLAHARGDHGAAVRGLRAALPRLIEIGGSHAQRDFFDQILLDALIRSGRLADAQQALELRRSFDPNGVPLNRSLAEVYRGLGLPAQAETADHRAQATLAAHQGRS